MRIIVFTLVCSALLLMGGFAMANESPTSLLNHNELMMVQNPQANIVVNGIQAPMPPSAWAGYGTREFGPNYRSYVPLEIKSNAPDVTRSWDPAGHPGNGNQQTPEGLSCASDADCVAPLGCFDRADSGMVARKVCAVPPGQ